MAEIEGMDELEGDDTVGEGEIRFRINRGACAVHKSTGGALYGLGFLGAVVYYISTAPDFWAGVVGFFKALLWPAFLVHGLLAFLGL